MVNWKTGLVLLVLLAGLGAYWSSTRPSPPSGPLGKILPCDAANTVFVRVEEAGKVVEVQRARPGDHWQVTIPVDAPADPEVMTFFVGSFHSVDAMNTITNPQPLVDYGLDTPSRVVTCRVNGGSSYTLSIGKASFDGSGYYAQRAGDSRVYVISAVPVDEFDREVADPPVRSTPTPAGPSPRPS